MTILENVFKSNFMRSTYFHVAKPRSNLSNFAHAPAVLILSLREYNNFGIRKFTLSRRKKLICY
jgi:hypothetical protein